MLDLLLKMTEVGKMKTDKESLPLILFDTLDARNINEFEFNDYLRCYVFNFFKERVINGPNDIFGPSNFVNGFHLQESSIEINEITFASREPSYLLGPGSAHFVNEARFSFYVGQKPILYGIPVRSLKFNKEIRIERNQYFQIQIYHKKAPPENLELMCSLHGVKIREIA